MRHRIPGLVALALIALFALLSTAALAEQQIPQVAELRATDSETGDHLGGSVEIDGTTIVAGAQDEDSYGSSSGAAYVFVDNGTRWYEQAKLTHGSLKADDRFGVAVAVSGDNAVVGADGDDGAGAEAGTAYAFTRASEAWSAVRVLTPSDPQAGDQFGLSVAVSGDTAVVGAPHKNGGASPGAVYVFTKSGSNWTQQQKLTASDGFAGDLFGMSVAIDGDTVVIGTPNDDDNGSGSGSAYVFTRSAGVWTERTKIVPGAVGIDDAFGTDVAIDGTTIALGAPYDDDAYGDAGAIYTYSGSGATWAGPAKLLGNWTGIRLGSALDFDGDVLVGNKATISGLLTWEGSDLSWSQYYGPGGSFADDVATSADVIVSGIDSGQGYLNVFELPAGSDPLTYWDNNVSVTFSDVTVPASLFRATFRLDSVNPAPAGYVMTEQTLFDLFTTVSYSGTFTVGIPYLDSNVPNWLNSDGPVAEADLRMLHWNGASWDDITSSVDTATNRVYGIASSMSEFVIVETGEATSNPYWDWDPAGANAGSLDTPHKDYQLTTQKCQVCHAVHQANPDGELLLPTTRANACIYCHITTTLGGIVIYGGDPDEYLIEDDFGHQYDGGDGVACADCHSVHGSNTIGGDQGWETKILHAGGYQAELVAHASGGDETTITSGGTPGVSDWGVHFYEPDLQLSAFCTRCHQNFSLTSTQTIAATGKRTHPMILGFGMGSVADYPDRFGYGVDYAWMPSSGCNYCHRAGEQVFSPARGQVGIHVQSFPHSNPGYSKFLTVVDDMEDTWGREPAPDPMSDDVCSNCHIWDADAGTGRTY